eukprot:13568148-Alexandrium_andersonii.AAC.1
MDGGPPGRVEKKRRFRAKGDHCPESSLQVLDDRAPPRAFHGAESFFDEAPLLVLHGSRIFDQYVDKKVLANGLGKARNERN